MAKEKSVKKQNGAAGGSASGKKAAAVKAQDSKRDGSNKKKTPDKKRPAKPVDKGPSFWAKTKQFFREVRIELKKVTWPSRKETIASTAVVIALVILVATYLGLVDAGLSRILEILLPKVK